MKPNEKGLPLKPKAQVKTTEFFLFTTTTDYGDKHTVDGDTTYWTEAVGADENAQGCGGVVLRVHVAVKSVETLKSQDYRKPKVAGFVVISCDEEIVSYGKERADAILAFNKLNPRHPFGVGSETVWPATQRLLDAYQYHGTSTEWDADKMGENIIDLKK